MTEKPANRFQPRTRYKTVKGLEMEDVKGEQPRLGKIRLGIKVKKSKEDSRCNHPPAESCMYCTYPKDVDYFVCPPEVQEVYGDKPRLLEVLLPGDELSEFFEYKLAWYKGNKKICYGNNETATRINEETGETFTMECPCEQLKTRDNPKGPCNLKANLMVILPRVSMAGCYQVDTGSHMAVRGILRQIDYVGRICHRIGFIPLHLIREEESFQYTDEKKQQRSGKRWILKIRLPKEINYAKLAAFREFDVIGLEGKETGPEKALPPPPVDDGPDDAPGAIVVNEGDEPPDAVETEIVDTPEAQQAAALLAGGTGLTSGSTPPEEEEEPFPAEDGDEQPEAAPENEPPPRPATTGPKISKARQNIMSALLLSKGYKSSQEADQFLNAKYNLMGIAEIPAADYDRIKDEISKLPNRS